MADQTSSFDPAEHVQLVSNRRMPYRELSGYQKFHRLPEKAGPSETRFLHELCVPELDAQLEAVFSKLRKEFGLKRKQIVANPVEAGCGVIETPSFNYALQTSLDEDSPSDVIFTGSVSNITDPDQLVSEAFQNTFGDQFRELVVTLPESLSVEEVVDLLEEIEPEFGAVDYDKDCTWCELQIPEDNAIVRIDAQSICVKSLEGGSPAVLFEVFLRVKQILESVVNFKSQT